MSPLWFLFSVLAPPGAAVLSWAFLRRDRPEPAVVVVFNAIMPGSGLAVAGRPFMEILFAVLMAQFSLLIAGGPSMQYLGPIAMIGAVWGLIHTEWSPLARQGEPTSSQPTGVGAGPAAAAKAVPGPYDTVGGMVRRPESEIDEGGELNGYRVAVGCTECGADIEVPVLHNATRCSYCGSHHLVIGHDDVLQVAIPAKITSVSDLRETVLDHLRYRHYLQLYKKTVAPLERQATQAAPTGGLAASGDFDVAAAAAERAISLKADHYRERLEETLKISRSQNFHAPYRHAVGTLFQAAFGRDRRTQDKCLVFSMATLEAAVAAQRSVDLPPMGKLSYLKSLVPAADLPSDTRVLAYDLPSESVDEAWGDLSRKQLDRTIQTIKLGSSFNEEARAIVWRPWWVAEVSAPGIQEILLVDGGSGSVAGSGFFQPNEVLSNIPEETREAGGFLRFQPMECPTCGFEFPYQVDAVLHFCANCHRLFEANSRGKREISYGYVEPTGTGETDLVPFWVFPLNLATGNGTVITDLVHLKDGIDGTLDQIGEGVPQRQDEISVPAIRCVNSRLMATAFNRLFHHLLRNPPTIQDRRLPLDRPSQPWPVNLEEGEVRSFVSLYLANAFSPRDIARANIHQVQSWLFEGENRSRGRLTYIPIPRTVTESFRPYVGRYARTALAGATGKGTKT